MQARDLLVQACFSKGAAAQSAFDQWEQSTDFDAIDDASRRILPQLPQERISKSLRGKIQGITRHTFTRNHLLFHATTPFLQALQEAEIEVMLLKGSALVAKGIFLPSERPMNDIDILIPKHSAHRALQAATDLGWHAKHLKFQLPKTFTPTFTTVHHTACFQDQGLGNCDFHWKLLPYRNLPLLGLEEDVWQKRTKVHFQGLELFAPCQEDLLIHACVHGTSIEKGCEWVGDVLRLLHENLDWERILRLSRRHLLTVPLRDTLTYIHDTFEGKVPKHILAKLQPTEEDERASRNYNHNPPLSPLQRWGGNARLLFGWHRRLQQHPTFAHFLKDYFGLESLFALPSLLLKAHSKLFCAGDSECRGDLQKSNPHLAGNRTSTWP